MDCDFTDGSKGVACTRCGYVLNREFSSPPSRNCKGEPGLGDIVANGIKRAARAMRVSRWFCETPLCGCKKRRRDLNRFGRWVSKWPPFTWRRE